jgi:demethylmenaquinone methyltransferase/2-methoxy-6-polyprenyl-1,4-benzoquinol methylase
MAEVLPTSRDEAIAHRGAPAWCTRRGRGRKCNLDAALEQAALYYAHRAPEFEEVYRRPECQDDLRHLRQLLRQRVAGQHVLEVACGTGYWTRAMAHSATTVTATDINEAMLAVARRKHYGPAQVLFRVADAWRLDHIPGPFTAGAALFWWSHVPRSRLGAFLDAFHGVLQPGARVILADHLPNDHRRASLSRRDPEGNTYQRRALHTGETFEIIKNYPDEAELRATLARRAEAVTYTALKCVWVVECAVPGRPGATTRH